MSTRALDQWLRELSQCGSMPAEAVYAVAVKASYSRGQARRARERIAAAVGSKGGKATQPKGRATGDREAGQGDCSGDHEQVHVLEQASRQVVKHAEPEPEMKSVRKKGLFTPHDDDSACAAYIEWMAGSESPSGRSAQLQTGVRSLDSGAQKHGGHASLSCLFGNPVLPEVGPGDVQ